MEKLSTHKTYCFMKISWLQRKNRKRFGGASYFICINSNTAVPLKTLQFVFNIIDYLNDLMRENVVVIET